MKKRIVFALLALTMLLSLVACGEPAKENKTEEPTVTTENKLEDKTDDPSKNEVKEEDNKEEGKTDAAAIINKAWDKLAEDKKFPVMGGDFDTPVDGKAGKFDIKNTENATATLHITEDSLGKVIDAAVLTHMMNANTFTCAAYQVKADDAKALADSLKDSIKGTQWMCGFPDTLIIYTVNGEYVLAAYGNAEAISNFKGAINEAYGDAAVLNAEESLA